MEVSVFLVFGLVIFTPDQKIHLLPSFIPTCIEHCTIGAIVILGRDPILSGQIFLKWVQKNVERVGKMPLPATNFSSFLCLSQESIPLPYRQNDPIECVVSS
jgi:hypothetical protein